MPQTCRNFIRIASSSHDSTFIIPQRLQVHHWLSIKVPQFLQFQPKLFSFSFCFCSLEATPFPFTTCDAGVTGKTPSVGCCGVSQTSHLGLEEGFMSVQAEHCHVSSCFEGWGVDRDVDEDEAEIGFLSLFLEPFVASASLTRRETGRPWGLMSGLEEWGTGGG